MLYLKQRSVAGEVILLMTVGRKLKNIREDKGLSVDDVAQDLDLTRQAIYNYEADMRVPRDEIKLKLADYYGVSVEEIFFNTKSNKTLHK